MKLRIVELLIVVGVFAFACASLKWSDHLFETLFFSFTLLVIWLASLLAIASRKRTRAFCSGFALTAIAYMLFSHCPDSSGMVPRQYGPEVTTKILELGFNWLCEIEAEEPPSSGGFFSVDDDGFDFGVDNETEVNPYAKEDGQAVPFPSNLTVVVNGGQTLVNTSFFRIGHSAWALLLGWFSGHICRLAYVRSRSETPG